MSKYENLQKKPRLIPFLSIVLQIYLIYLFLAGTYSVFGVQINLSSVFEWLGTEKQIDPNSFVTLFNWIALLVISAIYIGFVISMLKTVFASLKQSFQLKKLLKADVLDVTQVRNQLGIMIANTKHLVYLSLTFLCYTRLTSVYAMNASMVLNLLIVLLICMLVEARYLSYIQGKRFFFSFVKSLAGYLFGIVAVVIVFHLNMTFFDYVYGLFGEGFDMTLVTVMDWVYYLYVDIVLYVAPLGFALGLMRLFKLMFKKSKHATNSAEIVKGTNFYLVIAVLFTVLTCVLLGLRDQAVSFDYYFKIVIDYAAIILGAITAKLLIAMANRRVKYPVKLIEIPANAKHTLD